MFSNGCWNGRTQSGRVVEHVAVHHGIRAGEMSLRPVQEQRNVDRRVRARQWELRWNCYAMVMAEVARPAEESRSARSRRTIEINREAAARRARRTSRTRSADGTPRERLPRPERAKWSGDSANAYLERATKGSRDKVEKFGGRVAGRGCVLR